jgi:YD repeat-containing protein
VSATVDTPQQSLDGGAVELQYTLKHGDSQAATVLVEFSPGPGRAFQVASSAGGEGLSDLSTSPAGARHLFLWDSLLDLGRIDAEAVRLRVTPGGGAGVATAPFQVRHNAPPHVSFTAVRVLRGLVEVDYALLDEESDLTGLEVAFSADGQPFRTATPAPGGDGLFNLAATPQGAAHQFVWNSATDLGQAQATVVLELRGTGARAGPAVRSAPFSLTGDGRPWVSLTAPTQPLSGDVELSYLLFAPEAPTADLALEYSLNGGATFATATPATGSEGTLALATSAQGVAHVFKWNTIADLGRLRRSGVVLRLWPSAQGRAGAPLVVSGLLARNNNPPSVTIEALPAQVSNSVKVAMEVFDDERDPTLLRLEYSVDGGAFLPATSSDGALIANQRYQSEPGGMHQHTYWDTVVDLGRADVANVRLRVTPSDRALDVGEGPAAISNSFTVIGPPRVLATSGFVHGLVLDDATEQPLADAQVTIDGVLGTFVTGPDGRFSFPTPDSGRFAIFGSRQGYVDAKRITWIDSRDDRAINPLRMVRVDSRVNLIVAAQGGVALNAAGTIRVTIPPGALTQDIPLTITEIAGNDQLTVDPAEGKAVLSAAQLGPCHVEFTQPVKIEFKNTWGLPPGTQVNANFLQHDRDNDHVPALTDRYDFTSGQVTPDGLWLAVEANHFSCIGMEPVMAPEDGAGAPDPDDDDSERSSADDCPGAGSETGSLLCYKDGSLTITETLPAVLSGGVPQALEFTYRSTLASPRAVIGSNASTPALAPQQLRTALSVAGQFQQAYLSASASTAFSSGYIWNGHNGRGGFVPTGAYPYSVTNESAYPMTRIASFRPRAHGGGGGGGAGGSIPLLRPPPQLQWLTRTSGGRVGIINERSSHFGSGWILGGLSRLHQTVGGGLFLQTGASAITLVNRGYPQGAPVLFPGPLGRGLAVDGAGTVYAGYGATILKRAGSNLTTLASLPATVTSIAGVAGGGVIAGLANGDVVSVSSTGGVATVVSAVAVTGVSAVAVAPGSGDIYVGAAGRVYRLDAAGPFDLGAEFPAVTGLAVSGTGDIFVSYSSRIEQLRVGGEVRPFAVVPGGNPSGQLALDTQGTLYLAVAGTAPAAVWAIGQSGRVAPFLSELTWVETNGVAAHPTQRIVYMTAQDSQQSVDTLHTSNSEALFEPETTNSSGLRLLRAVDGSATLGALDGTETRFNSAGQMTSVTTVHGTTTYDYDGSANLVRVTNEYGRRTELR